MRGKEHRSHVSGVGPGITPAYAGKRKNTTSSSISTKDHPRVCGEKEDKAEAIRESWGSPPHIRGKETVGFKGLIAVGITPALAGKRRTRLRPSEKAGDHPRACGEKYAVNAPDGDVKGSPPHLRGKVGQGLRLAALPRITPAYAGKRWHVGANQRPL